VSRLRTLCSRTDNISDDSIRRTYASSLKKNILESRSRTPELVWFRRLPWPALIDTYGNIRLNMKRGVGFVTFPRCTRTNSHPA